MSECSSHNPCREEYIFVPCLSRLPVTIVIVFEVFDPATRGAFFASADIVLFAVSSTRNFSRFFCFGLISSWLFPECRFSRRTFFTVSFEFQGWQNGSEGQGRGQIPSVCRSPERDGNLVQGARRPAHALCLEGTAQRDGCRREQSRTHSVVLVNLVD